MTITEALAKSPKDIACRYDDDGHLWLFRRDSSYIMQETNVMDPTGEPGDCMWRGVKADDHQGLTDWMPWPVRETYQHHA